MTSVLTAFTHNVTLCGQPLKSQTGSLKKRKRLINGF